MSGRGSAESDGDAGGEGRVLLNVIVTHTRSRNTCNVKTVPSRSTPRAGPRRPQGEALLHGPTAPPLTKAGHSTCSPVQCYTSDRYTIYSSASVSTVYMNTGSVDGALGSPPLPWTSHGLSCFVKPSRRQSDPRTGAHWEGLRNRLLRRRPPAAHYARSTPTAPRQPARSHPSHSRQEALRK